MRTAAALLASVLFIAPLTAPAPAQTTKPADPVLPGGQTVDLRPKFEKGQRVGYTMKIRSENEIGAVPGGDGKPSKQTTEQEIGLIMRVTDADREKGATVELVYESLKLKLKSETGDLEFDSTKPAKKPAAPKGKRDPLDKLAGEDAIDTALHDMVGTTLTLTVDPSGKITSVKGGEKLAAPGLLGGLGAIKPDAKSLGGLFGPISTRGGSGPQVKVGEKWSYTDAMDLFPLGSMKMTTEHQLRTVRGSQADLAFTGRIEPVTDGSGAAMPMQIKDSVYAGKYTWDTRKGQLEKMTSQQQITIDGRAAGLPGKSVMKTDITVERKDAR